MVDNFDKSSIIASIILHLAIIGTLIILGLLKFSNNIISNSEDGMSVSLVSSSNFTHHHLVTAPTSHEAPTKSPTKINTPTPLVSNADINLKEQKVKPNPTKNDNAKATKVISQKKAQTSTQVLDDFVGNIGNEASSTQANKNTGSTSNSIGNGNTLSKNDYAKAVIEQIKPYVIIPENVNPRSMVIVEVILLPNMQIYNINIIKPSGNIEYDNNVQEAIKRLKVFPEIPKNAKWVDYRRIVLIFRPT